jgi:CRP-like cAMP-binding protein
MDIDEIYAKQIALFQGVGRDELKKLLGCLGAREASYRRGETIWLAGERLHSVGVVLEGQVNAYRDDILGNRTLMAAVTPSGLFGETIVCAGLSESPVTAEAGADSRVLMVGFEKAIRPCKASCTFHNALIRNMLGVLAEKNIALGEKISHISKKTTRQKLVSYLTYEATRQRSRTFDIPLNRQALADYLCVNRSALSRELSAICAEGALSCNRSRFEILDPERLEEILLAE